MTREEIRDAVVQTMTEAPAAGKIECVKALMLMDIAASLDVLTRYITRREGGYE